MTGRLIFETNNNEIITADIRLTMKDTKGLYQESALSVMDLKIIGVQWLAEEPA